MRWQQALNFLTHKHLFFSYYLRNQRNHTLPFCSTTLHIFLFLRWGHSSAGCFLRWYILNWRYLHCQFSLYMPVWSHVCRSYVVVIACFIFVLIPISHDAKKRSIAFFGDMDGRTLCPSLILQSWVWLHIKWQGWAKATPPNRPLTPCDSHLLKPKKWGTSAALIMMRGWRKTCKCSKQIRNGQVLGVWFAFSRFHFCLSDTVQENGPLLRQLGLHAHHHQFQFLQILTLHQHILEITILHLSSLFKFLRSGSLHRRDWALLPLQHFWKICKSVFPS